MLSFISLFIMIIRNIPTILFLSLVLIVVFAGGLLIGNVSGFIDGNSALGEKIEMIVDEVGEAIDSAQESAESFDDYDTDEREGDFAYDDYDTDYDYEVEP